MGSGSAQGGMSKGSEVRETRKLQFKAMLLALNRQKKYLKAMALFTQRRVNVMLVSFIRLPNP